MHSAPHPLCCTSLLSAAPSPQLTPQRPGFPDRLRERRPRPGSPEPTRCAAPPRRHADSSLPRSPPSPSVRVAAAVAPPAQVHRAPHPSRCSFACTTCFNIATTNAATPPASTIACLRAASPPTAGHHAAQALQARMPCAPSPPPAATPPASTTACIFTSSQVSSQARRIRRAAAHPLRAASPATTAATPPPSTTASTSAASPYPRSSARGIEALQHRILRVLPHRRRHHRERPGITAACVHATHRRTGPSACDRCAACPHPPCPAASLPRPPPRAQRQLVLPCLRKRRRAGSARG